MARQLPGLYWDDDRQRYFPLASRLASAATAHPSPSPSPSPPRPALLVHRRRTHPLAHLRAVLRTAHKDALIHQIHSSQILRAHTVARSTVPSRGSLSAFHSVCHNGRVWSFAGDTLGWLHASVRGDEHGEMDVEWQPQCYLSSEVSSICVSGTTCVATSFGPECRILSAPLDLPVEVIHRIDSHIVHDIWTADLQGSRLVLGANKQAVVIHDIAVSASLHRLPTQSDVFALAQRDNALYTGLRNGGILRFDTRLRRSNGHPLFDSVSRRTSSITALKHLRDHQLLASFIGGEISTFDLRFPVRMPLMTFTGNFNKYTVRLPLVTDPCEKFLFAAGQDNRIRLWSLITGGPALDPGETGSIGQTVFQRPFEQRVAALQVVEEREGMYLLAASGTELCKYSLGRRSGMCI